MTTYLRRKEIKALHNAPDLMINTWPRPGRVRVAQVLWRDDHKR